MGMLNTVVKQAPFRIDREGWGEFDMQIFLTEADKGATHTVDHDLNFRSERYEHERTVVRLPDKCSRVLFC